ncbi:MAG: oxidoreductase [Planctomyces sp.]|nr:oxidoreductase [Planctomyces sp.]
MAYPADDKYQFTEPPEAGDWPDDVIISDDTRREDRIPPGQSRTKKWPVLQYGRIPVVSAEQWTLRVYGLVENPLELDYAQFLELPRVKVFADFHCVTRWSRLGNLWEGVSFRSIMELAGVKAEARFVIVGGYDDGWTTNMPLADCLVDDVLVCDRHDGEPLSAAHGGPVRLIVPKLYAWKSAKWLRSITFVEHDQRGTWEQVGYHDRGDPWVEERMWV